MNRQQTASPRSGRPPEAIDSPGNAERSTSEQGRINLESAWRAHAAQEGWAAKIDTKASIFLAVNGVVLSATLAARSQKGGLFAALEGWRNDAVTGAILLCALAGLLATTVVFPVLGTRPANIRNRGTIYFGDLRHRQAGELAHQLARLTLEDQFEQVSRQLIAMARTTWIKHRLLQAALSAALIGFSAIMCITTFR